MGLGNTFYGPIDTFPLILRLEGERYGKCALFIPFESNTRLDRQNGCLRAVRDP